MKRLTLVFAIVFIAVATYVTAALAQNAQSKEAAQLSSSQAGAKALFYDPVKGQAVEAPRSPQDPATGRPRVRPVAATTPDTAKFVGVHYWIELEGTGPVVADRSFKTGDRIKLHLRSNVEGHLALWTLDPTGQGTMLFPTGGKEASSPVKADSEYVTPGFIKFQPPAQEERLLVFFSRQKSDLPLPASMPPVANESEAVSRALGPTGARSLVFETEQKDPAEVGSYVVNRNGGPIVKEIRLKHQGQ